MWEQKWNIPVKHLVDKIKTKCSQTQYSKETSFPKALEVCGTQVTSWRISYKLQPLTAKIHPYNLLFIKVRGTALCSIIFKSLTVPVKVLLFGKFMPVNISWK